MITGKPSFIENNDLDEFLEFLDELRMGPSDMLLANENLIEEFGLSRPQARSVLRYWMETFSERSNKTGVTCAVCSSAESEDFTCQAKQ